MPPQASSWNYRMIHGDTGLGSVSGGDPDIAPELRKIPINPHPQS